MVAKLIFYPHRVRENSRNVELLIDYIAKIAGSKIHEHT